MNEQEFEKIASYIKNVCGISLGPEKKYLIEQRLTPILSKFGVFTLSELASKLQSTFDSFIREQMIVAITTNETSFFRDSHPYELFSNVIVPELVKRIIERKQRLYQRRGPKVSIWSAACSTGQEPYSLAMKIQSYLNSHYDDVQSEDFKILATDISNKVLSRAINGTYSDSDLQRGLTSKDIETYFHKDGDEWVAKEEIRSLVEFQTLNLIKPFAHIGSFDVIFCRNVLIYFEEETKIEILKQMYEMLCPGGILVLGAAESMYGLHDSFISEVSHNSRFFRKPE